MNWFPQCSDCKIEMERKELTEGGIVYVCPKCKFEIDPLDDDFETN